MVELEEGVSRQFDAEQLHDFRVAIRRTRSTARMAKRHLPEHARSLAPEWRWLASATSNARDLDVLLAALDAARSSLAPEHTAGLDELAERVAKERVRAQQGVHRVLLGNRYAVLKGRWERAIDELTATEQPFPDSDELARELVSRATRQLARRAKRIDRQSPPAAVHDVRKKVKRLRYTLESFGSALSKKRVKPALRDAKRLQDTLGRFQDDDIQRRLVAALLDEPSELSDDAVAAGRALVTVYDRRLKSARRGVAKQVRAFRHSTSGSLQ
jgi:CHAD domain-containing protein